MADGAPESGLVGLEAAPSGAGAVAALVGRQRELAELLGALDAVTRGHGTLWLLEGEPGIGKTHLAAALSEHARAAGFTVLWGRCWEDGGAPAFWPWTQILRDLVDARLNATQGDVHEPLLTRVASIVPELAAAPAESGAEPTTDQGRFALFDAVTTILRQAAASSPLLLVFDDVHAADLDSLRLLQFVARDLPHGRIAMVATYRAADARRSGTGTLLARMGRDGRVLPLRGLTEAEVGEFVEQIAGEPARTAVIRTVHQATQGNPLFVDSITHLLVAEQRLQLVQPESAMPGERGRAGSLPLPPNIREAIGMRLAYLDGPTRDLLRVASVIGRTFTCSFLASVAGRPIAALDDALHVAVDHGAISPADNNAGRFVFDHMLVRDTLYGELDPRRRTELHGRVGMALERFYADDVETHSTEIAHHFLLAAVSVSDAIRAVDAASRAGRRALSQSAYDEAAALFTRALDIFATSSADSEPIRRCELLLELGAARIRSGDTAAGRSVYLDAAAIAREQRLPEQLAEAAIGYAGMTGYHFSGRRDDSLVSLLEEALAALPPGDSDLRVRLLARLAVGLYWSDFDGRRFELSEEAVAMGRRLHDLATLAMAIHSRRYAQWGPDNFEQRLADATQCLQLALEANDLEIAVSARRWRFTDLLEDGDAAMAERELDAHDALAQRLRQPFLLALTSQFRALWTIMQGRFADGEALAIEARSLAERAGNPLAHVAFGQQMLPVWLQQRREDELDGHLAALRRAAPHPATASAMALIQVERGEREAAAALVEQLATPGLTKFRHDMLFLPGLACLSLVTARLGDSTHSEHLYEQMRPYAGRIVVVGAPAQACWGPVDHYLGMLAAQSSVYDAAADHFEAALELNRRLGSACLLAETRCEYGRMLSHQRGTGDATAADHLDAARRTAAALGMAALLQRIDAAAPAPTGGEGVAARPLATSTTTESAPCTLHRDGDYWSLLTASGTTHLRDTRGLQHLADLLDAPGRRLHVIELGGGSRVGAAGSAVRPASRGELQEAGIGYSTGFGDAGELLDDAAKSAYRLRLEELDESIAEAERFNDIGTAAQFGEERDLLIDELARSVGLGGRDRRAASTSERARVNVTRAIRSAIRRIGQADPAAGRYLDATVVTGTYCVFEPERAR